MATADQRRELAAALGPEFMVFERISAQMGIGYSDFDVMFSSEGIELSELVPTLDPSGPDVMPKLHEAAERLRSQAIDQLRQGVVSTRHGVAEMAPPNSHQERTISTVLRAAPLAAQMPSRWADQAS